MGCKPGSKHMDSCTECIEYERLGGTDFCLAHEDHIDVVEGPKGCLSGNPKSNFSFVRVAVAVRPDGSNFGYGNSILEDDQLCRELRCLGDTSDAIIHHVEAYIPFPRNMTIRGRVGREKTT
jgi:hypothetical protein